MANAIQLVLRDHIGNSVPVDCVFFHDNTPHILISFVGIRTVRVLPRRTSSACSDFHKVKISRPLHCSSSPQKVTLGSPVRLQAPSRRLLSLPTFCGFSHSGNHDIRFVSCVYTIFVLFFPFFPQFFPKAEKSLIGTDGRFLSIFRRLLQKIQILCGFVGVQG